MWYEVKLKVTKQDNKGNDKEIAESFACDVELFAQAEQKGMEQYNGECDVVAIKRSNVREFANDRDTSKAQNIYKATIEDTFVSDDGSEKKTKYHVALFATDVREATSIAESYMAQGLNDMTLVSVSKTSLLDII